MLFLLLALKAGIAQLVEQATENRRVRSSNLRPGTILLSSVSYTHLRAHET